MDSCNSALPCIAVAPLLYKCCAGCHDTLLDQSPLYELKAIDQFYILGTVFPEKKNLKIDALENIFYFF